jgi:hypothetical protein
MLLEWMLKEVLSCVATGVGNAEDNTNGMIRRYVALTDSDTNVSAWTGYYSLVTHERSVFKLLAYTVNYGF